MPLRFVDLDSRESHYKDFVIRKRSPRLSELYAICATLILVGVGVILLVRDPLALSSLLFTVIGAACLYSLTHVHRHRLLLQKTEFENALFSSSLGIDFDFCLIANEEGHICYRNPNFIELFGASENETVDAWLSGGGVRDDVRDQARQLIADATGAKIPLDINSHDGRALALTLEAKPIPRPAGFILLRGSLVGMS